jgi:hypothetical protein
LTTYNKFLNIHVCRYFGHYQCSKCKLYWRSGYCWKNETQKCIQNILKTFQKLYNDLIENLDVNNENNMNIIINKTATLQNLIVGDILIKI